MPIIQNQPNTDNSPWYDIMEERALTWSEFAKKNNLDIEGYYNASIVTFESKNSKLDLFGIRQVSNVSTLLNIGLEQISEELNITLITSEIPKKKNIRIRKSRIWNVLRKKLNNTIIFENYYVTYNDENLFQELIDIGIFDFDKLKKLIMSKSKVKLVLHELPVKTDAINSFLSYCKTLK